jgi:hypothetical protein
LCTCVRLDIVFWVNMISGSVLCFFYWWLLFALLFSTCTNQIFLHNWLVYVEIRCRKINYVTYPLLRKPVYFKFPWPLAVGFTVINLLCLRGLWLCYCQRSIFYCNEIFTLNWYEPYTYSVMVPYLITSKYYCISISVSCYIVSHLLQETSGNHCLAFYISLCLNLHGWWSNLIFVYTIKTNDLDMNLNGRKAIHVALSLCG